MRSGGSFAKETFIKAVTATTEARVQEMKSKMSAEATAILSNVPDSEQFMACAGHMHGENTEAAASAFIADCEQVLGMDMYSALRTICMVAQKRFYHSKKSAWGCPATFPHSVSEAIREHEIKATKDCQIVNFPHEAMGDRTVAEVKDHTNGETYETNLATGTCMCGQPGITGLPDAHIICHAKAVGRPTVSVMDIKDTVEGWRRQYPVDLEFMVPSEATVSGRKEVNKTLKLPPILVRPRGRPSKKK